MSSSEIEGVSCTHRNNASSCKKAPHSSLTKSFILSILPKSINCHIKWCFLWRMAPGLRFGMKGGLQLLQTPHIAWPRPWILGNCNKLNKDYQYPALLYIIMIIIIWYDLHTTSNTTGSELSPLIFQLKTKTNSAALRQAAPACGGARTQSQPCQKLAQGVNCLKPGLWHVVTFKIFQNDQFW